LFFYAQQQHEIRSFRHHEPLIEFIFRPLTNHGAGLANEDLCARVGDNIFVKVSSACNAEAAKTKGRAARVGSVGLHVAEIAKCVFSPSFAVMSQGLFTEILIGDATLEILE
jgi:hypothetical protein